MTEEYSGESPWRRSRIVVPVPAPAAGADWTLTVPAGHLYDVVNVYATLTTSVAAPVRAPVLQATDGVATFYEGGQGATQAASLTLRYVWHENAPFGSYAQVVLGPIPRLRLMAGWGLRTLTQALDAADQWSNVRLYVVDTTVRRGSYDLDALPDMLVEIVSAGPAG